MMCGAAPPHALHAVSAPSRQRTLSFFFGRGARTLPAMGAYLSSPVTDKRTEEGAAACGLEYAVVSMQVRGGEEERSMRGGGRTARAGKKKKRGHLTFQQWAHTHTRSHTHARTHTHAQ